MSKLIATGVVGLTLLGAGGCERSLPATPTALGALTSDAKPSGVAYSVTAVTEVTYNDPTWLSTRPGSTNGNTLYTTWPDAAIAITPTAIGIGGCQRPAGAPPTRAPYELKDQGNMTVRSRSGTILGVTFYIQDVAGEAGIMHSTDEVAVESIESRPGGGFILHVHKDHRPIYRQKGHTGGPRVATIGCISVGDVVFSPQ